MPAKGHRPSPELIPEQKLLPAPNVSRNEHLLSCMAGIHPDYVELGRRVERSGGLDRHLKNKYEIVYKAMDSYLDEFFANQVLLGLADGGSDELIT